MGLSWSNFSRSFGQKTSLTAFSQIQDALHLSRRVLLRGLFRRQAGFFFFSERLPTLLSTNVGGVRFHVYNFFCGVYLQENLFMKQWLYSQVGLGSCFNFRIYPSLKQTTRTWKLMVSGLYLPFGARPIFRGDLFVFKEGYIKVSQQKRSRWWFQTFVIFIPTWGDDPIWRAYFSDGWFSHQQTRSTYYLSIFVGHPRLDPVDKSHVCVTPSSPCQHADVENDVPTIVRLWVLIPSNWTEFALRIDHVWTEQWKKGPRFVV